MFQINYRQADTVVVVVVVVVVAAGQPLTDDADRLPHQAVNRDVPVRRPRLADPLGNSSAVGRRFR